MRVEEFAKIAEAKPYLPALYTTFIAGKWDRYMRPMSLARLAITATSLCPDEAQSLDILESLATKFKSALEVDKQALALVLLALAQRHLLNKQAASAADENDEDKAKQLLQETMPLVQEALVHSHASYEATQVKAAWHRVKAVMAKRQRDYSVFVHEALMWINNNPANATDDEQSFTLQTGTERFMEAGEQLELVRDLSVAVLCAEDVFYGEIADVLGHSFVRSVFNNLPRSQEIQPESILGQLAVLKAVLLAVHEGTDLNRH